ncbi:hypothetical protein ACO0RG_004070 [Hanseniaspora osmophila]|uniref:Pre-rRNA-processing protein ESF1 n=1 Tax=Hanseniaspora osmophila TaxID=56408 RepID=A0A1E5RBN2_9ASCO|nr:Pre-rRNA-processing protein ESF1 [Hanseniaspora osmophila]
MAASNTGKSGSQTNDPRFANIANDPKFRKAKLNKFKVKLDDRFSKSDLEIGKKKGKKVDKYGRRILDDNELEKKDFDKYFDNDTKDQENEDKKETNASEDNEETSEEETAVKTKPSVSNFDRARGEVPSDYQSSSDESSSDSDSDADSFMEDESDSEIELEEQKPEDTDPTSVVACVNMDWDHLKSADLMMTFNSFVPKGGKILKVAIYPSEFGKERMAREEVEGPPRELFQSKKKRSKKHGKGDNSESDSDSDIEIKDLYEEGDADKDFDSKALRRYQLERLRYYYAIVTCNNVDTAKAIYDNCDKSEYEASSNMFDLRYVPEEMEFDEEPRDSCTELPKNYRPMTFTTDALQHSKVKLTWDETPADRMEVAKRAFSQKEIDDMDFKAYLASDSESEDDEATEEARNKLKSLVSNFGGSSFNNKKPQHDTFGQNRGAELADDGDDDDDEGEVDMEVTFTPALEADDDDEKAGSDKEESTIEKVRRKEQERRKKRKDKIKELKKQAQESKKDKLKSKDVPTTKDAKSTAELELLMMEDGAEPDNKINKKAHFNMNEILKSEKEKGKKSKYQNKERIIEDSFKPNLDDDRFNEIFEDHDFAIDPTQSEYKATEAMKQIMDERSKRKSGQDKKRKANVTNGAKQLNKYKKQKSQDKSSSNTSHSVKELVNKVKSKYKKN